jgi:hypothetical protein
MFITRFYYRQGQILFDWMFSNQWAQRAARKTGNGERHREPGRIPVQDKRNCEAINVPETCRFGLDPDPDPRIHASNSKIFSLLLFEGSFTSFFKDKKSK